MTKAEYWDRCYAFDWSFLTSLDHDEMLEGSCALTELRKLAVQHGPEYEQILNQFRKAHTYGHCGCVVPRRPDNGIGGTDA